MILQIEIDVEGRNIPITLNWDEWIWQSPEEIQEGDFPLIVDVDGKRYELYSDGTFAEVE